MQNHPEIRAAQGLAGYAAAEATATSSAYYPQLSAALTGVDAEVNSRITAGGLNNPIIYDRAAGGAALTQLVTDFGRTHELVTSADLHARAAAEGVVSSRADVVLRVEGAYAAALKAEAVLSVAEETVKHRQLLADQVATMAKSQLKSGLDVSFANVDLAQARLLLIQAQNDVQASYAALAAALGYTDSRMFTLADLPGPPVPPDSFSVYFQAAMRDRPELIAQRLDVTSAQDYATAQRDLWRPTISAAAAAGFTPYRATALGDHYAAVGLNVSVPLYNGHLFSALRSEASNTADVQSQSLRDLEDRVARDVRTAWLSASAGYQRLAVTDELLRDATEAEDFAEARYRIGLSSIVELSQAQLELTQAQLRRRAPSTTTRPSSRRSRIRLARFADAPAPVTSEPQLPARASARRSDASRDDSPQARARRPGGPRPWPTPLGRRSHRGYVRAARPEPRRAQLASGPSGPRAGAACPIRQTARACLLASRDPG